MISVPAGAFTKPAPTSMLTCPVRVWFVPTGLFAVGGVIWMFASELPDLARVPAAGRGVHRCPGRPVIVCPFTGMFDVACTTVVPTTAEVIVTVQLAVTPPPV